MILFQCALHCEAKPLISHLRLKKELGSHSHQIFSGGPYQLIISGIGQIKAAAACGLLFGLFKDSPCSLLLNVGSCGASESFPIGSIYLINKITSLALGRSLYPDILINHGLQEAELLTVEQPIDHINHNPDQKRLFDMEGFGFFKAASCFVPPDRIACLKIVSDHANPEKVAAKDLNRMIEQQLEAIISIVEAYSQLAKNSQHDTKESKAKKQAGLMANALRLTATQREQLADLILAYLAKGNDDLRFLEQYCLRAVTDKYQAKQILREIRERLNHA
jgi:adenosylhomocysteine nucleosidase